MEAWRQWLLGGRKSYPDEEQKTNLLDSDRPSHGRPFHALSGKVDFERNRDIAPTNTNQTAVNIQVAALR
jgi:hypothetical protein